MAPKVRRELLKIQREMMRNRPIVRKKLARGKKRVSETIISSVARHYKALDKLAKE
jgi:rRNA pseudouridine-1189 N-methylase Emg1 (Nep1/Mra1 family)